VTSFAKTIGIAVDIRTLPADPKRTSFAVFNKHATAILYLKEGSQVSTSNGIPVYPKGSMGVTYEEDGESVRESWSMVSNSADTEIIVFEGTKK